MNKFLWSLFGIREEEIPEGVPDLSRRGFLKMLGSVAVVGAAGPKYFLAPANGWRPEPVFQFGFERYKSLTSTTNDFIVPILMDNVFKPSPLFMQVMRKKGR